MNTEQTLSPSNINLNNVEFSENPSMIGSREQIFLEDILNDSKIDLEDEKPNVSSIKIDPKCLDEVYRFKESFEKVYFPLILNIEIENRLFIRPEL